MKKVIFLDIDGTIIDVPNGLKEPSVYTKYAICELIKNGHLVFIASGRFKANIHESIHSLNPSGYVTSNGGYIELNGKQLYSKEFDRDLYEELKEFCIENNAIFCAETQTKMYTPNINKTFKDFLVKWNIEYVPYIDDDNGLKFNKCVADFNNKEICNRFEDRFKGRLDMRVQTADPAGLAYDINIPDINKGSAVNIVIEKLGIYFNDTYCFCDGTNDIELAKACKYSFVMENGADELKQYAYEIVPSAVDDGVYKKLVELGMITPFK